MSDEKIGANAFEAMKIQAEELSRAKAAAPRGTVTAILQRAFMLAARNPKKAAGLISLLFGGAGISAPDWLAPALVFAGKACFWLAAALPGAGQ